MGVTVINRETVPQTVDPVACGSVPVRQPVMGISVMRKINTINTIWNTEVSDNTPTTCSPDLEDKDEVYCSRSLTGSLGPTSQDHPQRITDIKQSATDVITRDLPEDEGLDQPQRVTDIEESATDVMTRDLPEDEGIFIRRTPQMSSECPPACLQKREAKSGAHQKLAKLGKLIRPKKTKVQVFCPDL